ncbi:MAG TPA: hypothetical protein VMW49_04845 [Candidatus Dormibacteraeota bacterium]|nr:hypothetical protein [Candidatus Dormibacteraeota bacterium]
MFNLRTLGPEPSGATRIEEEDLPGLIPGFVSTRADLNQVEFENIAKALPWAQQRARSLGTAGILEYGCMMTLHSRMFGDVWMWAGTRRRRDTNIGVEPALITTQCRLLFDDAKFWHTGRVCGPDELAARIHCRLVSAQPFTWGGPEIDVDGSARATYIAALIRAPDTDDYVELIRFARGRP